MLPGHQQSPYLGHPGPLFVTRYSGGNEVANPLVQDGIGERVDLVDQEREGEVRAYLRLLFAAVGSTPGEHLKRGDPEFVAHNIDMQMQVDREN